MQSKAFSTLLTYMTNRLFRPTFDEKIVRILFGCKKENSSALAVILFFLHCERKPRRWFKMTLNLSGTVSIWSESPIFRYMKSKKKKKKKKEISCKECACWYKVRSVCYCRIILLQKSGYTLNRLPRYRRALDGCM